MLRCSAALRQRFHDCGSVVLQGSGDPGRDAFGSLEERVVAYVGVALRGGGGGVAEDSADEAEGEAGSDADGAEAVAEVVEA